MSRPPTLWSTSSTSPGAGRFTRTAVSMARIFLCRPSEDRPAPRPVMSSTGRSSSTAARAEEVVVLPMPISPVASSLTPRPRSSWATSTPARMAWTASSRLMAGPWVMLAVPRRTHFWRMRSPFRGVTVPMSTGTTSTPAARDMAHTLVSPVDMFSATMAVTSWPVWVTPSATTPLSAHMTTTARRERSTSGLPVMPAMRITASSSAPRLPRGLAMESHRAFARSMAFRSAGTIP